MAGITRSKLIFVVGVSSQPNVSTAISLEFTGFRATQYIGLRPWVQFRSCARHSRLENSLQGRWHACRHENLNLSSPNFHTSVYSNKVWLNVNPCSHWFTSLIAMNFWYALPPLDNKTHNIISICI